MDPRGRRPARGRGITRVGPLSSAVTDTSNIIANGTFGSSTGWVLGTNWTIAAGVLTATIVLAAGQVASTTFTVPALIPGVQYRVTYTMSTTAAGSVKFQLTGGATVNGSTQNADGTYAEIVTATAAHTGIQFIAVADYTGNIDNLSVQRVA